MTAREYLERFNQYQDVTFIKARARKDANTPGYHAEYQTTPIRTIADWKKSDKQCPIDWLSGAPWKGQFDRGHLISMLVISKEDLELLYSPEQAVEMIQYIDKKIAEAER